MNCNQVGKLFSEYLDGAISGREMQAMQQHLQTCGQCEGEFAAWRGLQQVLGTVGTVKAPEDLGLRLRLAISHENSRREGRWWNNLQMRWENMLRPALVQASAGLAGAIVLIGGIGLLIGVVAVPQPVLANDEPLGAMTAPHYLYSAVPEQPLTTSADTTIVIEAKVNSLGQVYAYTIVSGPSDAATDAQVRDQLLLQVYEPARVFGQAIKGQVLITFSGVSVRG